MFWKITKWQQHRFSVTSVEKADVLRVLNLCIERLTLTFAKRSRHSSERLQHLQKWFLSTPDSSSVSQFAWAASLRIDYRGISFLQIQHYTARSVNVLAAVTGACHKVRKSREGEHHWYLAPQKAAPEILRGAQGRKNDSCQTLGRQAMGRCLD